MKLNVKSFSFVWILYALLAFPSFYFVYKFGNPSFGTNDFFSYYKLYQNWDIASIDAPFNMRLLSSFFVFIFNKIGFHYDTECAFDQLHLSRQIFFNAIFFNYLCITTTCAVLYHTIRKYFDSILLAFVSGLVYLLGFGTLFYEFMPITDALSILLFAIILLFYYSKNYFIIIPLVLLVFQREYIYLALGLIALLDLWKYRSKYYLHILLMCIGCFVLYFILRKTIFYTPKYDYQASPVYFLKTLFELKFPFIPYVRQMMLTLNVFIIYLIIVIYKKYKKMEIDGFNLVKIIALFLQINIISFVAVFGNNTGRYFYILIPLLIFFLAKEANPLITTGKTK